MKLSNTPLTNRPPIIWTLKDYDAAIDEAVIRSEHPGNETAWEIAYEVLERLKGEIFGDFDCYRVLHDIHLRSKSYKIFTSETK